MISGEMQLGMSAALFVMIVIAVYKLSSYIGCLVNRLNDHDKRLDKNETELVTVKDSHDSSKLKIAILETKLDAIDLGIQELKGLFMEHLQKRRAGDENV